MFYNRNIHFGAIPLWALFIGTGLLLAAGCSGCDEESIEKPDLLYEFANLESDEVDSGNPLVLRSSILNEEATCDLCTTLAAAVSQRGLSLEYRPDEDSPWEPAQLQDEDNNIVFVIVTPVDEIEPGFSVESTDGFIFTEPGIYRFKLVTDRDDVVDERVETNNDADSDSGTVKSDSATPVAGRFRLMVTVKGKQNTDRDPNEPVVVKYLSY
ncbi:MAG: hypothetical protein J5I94_29130 [Phaeodactylibacter sp.]|nr:hypothetical protein [Phaeodactylibacter sp.]